MRLAEVLLLRASARPGPSGRRGPWLPTLGPTRWRRRRGDPEGPRRLFWVCSGEGAPEEFRGRGFPATSAGRWGPVEPGRRRTQVRELRVPPCGRDLGLRPELLPDASGWLRYRRCSRPAAAHVQPGKRVLSALLPDAGFDSFPPGVRGAGLSPVMPATSLGSLRLPEAQ